MNLPVVSGLKRMLRTAKLAGWQNLVRQIERQASTLGELTNAELRKRSLALRYDVLAGQSLDEALVPAAILVREAAARAINMRHYPVQLLGGIAMHYGSIAVMQTGEGKTLTATLPLYLAALSGNGAHLVTANDYLAARDAKLMAPVYELLGMSVGVIQSDTSRSQRRTAYQADITYTTAKEIGFDFLRDRLYQRQSQIDANELRFQLLLNQSNRTLESDQAPVQRDPNFILVDEADSILIDEARTPLVISAAPDEIVQAEIELYRWAAEHAAEFQADQHYRIDPEDQRLSLTEQGRKLVRKLPKPDSLRQTPILDIYDQTETAIHVADHFIKDRHYVVRDGEVVIVDEFSGRLAEGRKWRSGLHQAIEAKEGVDISIATGEAARVTVQALFLRYPRLSGMTGTVANSAVELEKIYRVGVIEIPTNRPPRRIQWPDQVHATEAKKWQAIADEIASIHQTGRPVLIGTRSIDKSEWLSQILTQQGIAHEVLNARNLAREADIVAQAGQVSRVTVATNMAGRGTDIQISSAAADLGGLHVICSEMHESARIDRQLIGRCGRQGDPGTFRMFMSLEDDLLKRAFGTDRFKTFKKYHGSSQISLQRLKTLFSIAQQRIEKKHFQARKMLLYQEKIRTEMQQEMGQDSFLDTAGAA